MVDVDVVMDVDVVVDVVVVGVVVTVADEATLLFPTPSTWAHTLYLLRLVGPSTVALVRSTPNVPRTATGVGPSSYVTAAAPKGGKMIPKKSPCWTGVLGT